jgi:glyoxylase-like metal-dependent hydrolase (beta-lactamase superfamily II)
MALDIKVLVFNAFQVNTYVVYHSNGECLLVDPACYTAREQGQLTRFLDEHQLTVKHVVNTHSHVDHVLGAGYVYQTYGIKPKIHRQGLVFYDHLVAHAHSFGFDLDEVVVPEEFLSDGDHLMLGDETLRILYTPGHADGSICLAYDTGQWIITGDLIFNGSIGRTDLPTGNLECLLTSVREKIFPNPDDYTLYPGHGQPTTIGFERRNNPYL